MQSLMGGFRLAVGRVSLVHTLCYCQHRARGRRARLDAGGQRMPCKFSSPSHPVLLSAQGPGGAEHVEVQEAGGGAPRVAWICCTPLSWSWTAELSPPQSASPQVTTDPSSRIAAKALPVSWICCTPLSWSWTAELSPPQSASPQVTIVLSPWHHKAKAYSVDASCGWSTRAVRHSPSSLSASSKVCSRFIKTRFLAVISRRYFSQRLVGPLSLHFEPWMKAEVLEAPDSHSAKRHVFLASSWRRPNKSWRLKTWAMNLYFTRLEPDRFLFKHFLKQKFCQMFLALDGKRTMADWRTKVDEFQLAIDQPTWTITLV